MFIRDNRTKKHPFRKLIDSYADNSNKTKTDTLYINNYDTNIPNNVPVGIIGDKGSGKTTLLKALADIMHKSKFVTIFYVYTSLSLDNELPEFVTRINIDNAESILMKYFEIKSIYNSYVKFFDKAKASKILEEYGNNNDEHSVRKLTEFLNICDNDIIKYNSEIVNSGSDIHVVIDKIIDTGEKIIKKFSEAFYIDGIKINGIKKNQYDSIIIDDIAIAAPILFKNMKSNSLYEYVTLSRHMRILIIFAGQQLDQLPKMMRREIMCWILSKNTNLELLTGILQKSVLKTIEDKQKTLKRYEFVVYNVVTDFTSVV